MEPEPLNDRSGGVPSQDEHSGSSEEAAQVKHPRRACAKAVGLLNHAAVTCQLMRAQKC